MDNLIDEAKLAIELEKKGYELYAKVASVTPNPLLKTVFLSLADRETLHMERVKEIYQHLTGEKKLSNDWLKAAGISSEKGALLKPMLQKLSKSLNFKADKKQEENNTKAYTIAKNLEKNSHALYSEMAKEAKDELTRSFFTALAKEESEHFVILDETLQYLNNPAEWFKKEERWIVEG